jgi:hypothetical protein
MDLFGWMDTYSAACVYIPIPSTSTHQQRTTARALDGGNASGGERKFLFCLDGVKTEVCRCGEQRKWTDLP